jgi:hypothetical protein
MLHNLERHPLHRHAYVAYDADGFAFRIARCGYGFMATPSHAGAAGDRRGYQADRLRDLAAIVGRSRQMAAHPHYNATNFPMFVQSHGPWDIMRDAAGNCAAIPNGTSSGHKASAFGNMAHVERINRARDAAALRNGESI